MSKSRAKMKFTEEKKVVVTFKDIANGDWNIKLNKHSHRKELKNKDQLLFSDINSEVCKNVALKSYGVDYNNWKIV